MDGLTLDGHTSLVQQSVPSKCYDAHFSCKEEFADVEIYYHGLAEIGHVLEYIRLLAKRYPGRVEIYLVYEGQEVKEVDLGSHVCQSLKCTIGHLLV